MGELQLTLIGYSSKGNLPHSQSISLHLMLYNVISVRGVPPIA